MKVGKGGESMNRSCGLRSGSYGGPVIDTPHNTHKYLDYHQVTLVLRICDLVEYKLL
jgi:hypothetical protein